MARELRLQKVFLAVRTNFFGIPDEHMTVKYFREVGWNTLMLHCDVLVRKLPVRIELDKPSHWEARDTEYYGWLIKHNNMNPIFPPMPHITIPEGVRDYHLPPEKGISWVQNHNTLFLGKRLRNPDKILWLKVNDEAKVNPERLILGLGYEQEKQSA